MISSPSILAAPLPLMMLLCTLLPVAAIGFSLIYLVLGGGVVGAIVIFFIAKMLGQ